MTFYKLAFDLRYYPSYQGFEGSRSGATVFRPATNESLRYSNLTRIIGYQGSVVSQFTLLYNNSLNEQATVHVRLTFDSPLIDFEVQMP